MAILAPLVLVNGYFSTFSARKLLILAPLVLVNGYFSTFSARKRLF